MTSPLRTSMWLAACVLGAMVGMNAGAAPATLPLYEDFQSYSIGNLPLTGAWSTNEAGGSATVQSTNAYIGQSCAVSLSDLTLNVSGAANYTNTWCMLWTKPLLYDDAALPSLPSQSCSVAFYVNTGGVVKALSDTNWLNVGSVGVGGGWLGFIVHSDYSAKKYDLYASATTNFTGVFRRLNASRLSMRRSTTATNLTALTVEGVAKLDSIVLAKEHTSLATWSKSNVVAVVEQFAANETKTLGLMPHAYNDTQNTLAADLGDDLKTWLKNTKDTVSVYTTATIDFLYNTGMGGWDTSGNPATTHVYPGTGVWLTRIDGGTLAMFFDYDVKNEFVSNPVQGTSSGYGMNFLAWDSTTQSPAAGAGNGLGFSPGVAGVKDRLYLYQTVGAKQIIKMLYWKNSKWYDGAAPSTDRIQPGDTFWYYRGSAGGSGSWNIGSAQ